MEKFKKLGAELSNWGRWGLDDRLGTLNLITESHVRDAARLVRTGRIFDLGLPIGAGSPPQRAESPRFDPVHLMLRSPDEVWPGGMIGADDMIVLPLQAVTQWDGLGHNGYDGQFYNGVPASSVTSKGSTIHSVHEIAAKGVVGRGVLLDVAHLADGPLGQGDRISPEDLDAACAAQGVTVGAGDILLIRTGWIERWTRDHDVRELWDGQPGLSLDCARWLHDRDVAAVLMDNTGVEHIPTDPGHGTSWPLHCVLIRDMGMTLGEMAVLDQLADDCHRDGVWEFLFVATPLKVERSVGSPITPIAVK
ncbi:cyclase family protein [Aeromicrobium panaciterrae]|uniref:cyclase family protein n=1 Tax=Aeromicrobium panaciterrae TaxID=363861 RepID=UPI0031D9C37D